MVFPGAVFNPGKVVHANDYITSGLIGVELFLFTASFALKLRQN